MTARAAPGCHDIVFFDGHEAHERRPGSMEIRAERAWLRTKVRKLQRHLATVDRDLATTRQVREEMERKLLRLQNMAGLIAKEGIGARP